MDTRGPAFVFTARNSRRIRSAWGTGSSSSWMLRRTAARAGSPSGRAGAGWMSGGEEGGIGGVLQEERRVFAHVHLAGQAAIPGVAGRRMMEDGGAPLGFGNREERVRVGAPLSVFSLPPLPERALLLRLETSAHPGHARLHQFRIRETFHHVLRCSLGVIQAVTAQSFRPVKGQPEGFVPRGAASRPASK